MTTRKRGARDRRVTQADINRTRRDIDLASEYIESPDQRVTAQWERAYPSKGGK